MASVSAHQATPPHNLSASSRTEAAGLQTAASPSYEIPRGDVTARLNFFLPPADGSVPFNYVETPPTGQPQRNFGDVNQQVLIHDIRGFESEYTLDNDAFAIIQAVPPSRTDFNSDESIKSTYYPEVESLLLSHVHGANRIVIFDHTIRAPPTHPSAKRTAVNKTHIDQTASATIERVRLHLGDEAESLLKHRYRIINVWRPLNGPVVSSPLAFASSHTVRDEDLVPVEHRYPHRTGHTASVKYNEGQKWNYLSGMRNDERILLECFDSYGLRDGSGVKGGRVPHSAFDDPRTPEGAVGRESIEVRCLVFGP